MCPLQPAYLLVPERRERLARAGAIDWFAYAEDLFERTGAPAVPLAPADLLDPGALARVSALALPDLPPGGLSADQLALLERWTLGGGMLLGFATAAADALFGVADEGRVEQPDGPFTATATFRFTDPELALPLLHPERPEPELVAFSPARLLRAGNARPLAAFADGHPAVTLRRAGSGWAVLFAFDPAQTCWVLHQGRPVDQDYYPDGFYRSNDGLVLGERDLEVPYADLLIGLLRNLLALTRQPFVYQLPALDGELPDALFFWGGDDEGCPAEQNLFAAEFMHGHGLPYHVNIMPNPQGEFHTGPELLPVLRRLGTEPSLHLNFMDGCQHPFRYTAADVARQVDWYVDYYREQPICTVFHCTLWHGWTEPAEYLRAAGVEADNSRFGRVGANPINHLSYSAGTSLPYFVRLASGERLDFVCEAINAYEPGYQRDGRMELEPLHRTLSDAAWWHSTMNLFYHSVCIHGYAECRQAIAAVPAWLAERGVRTVHLGCDAASRWWRARTAARFAAAEHGDGELQFGVDCAWPAGYGVLVPLESGEAEAVVDGRPVPLEIRHEHGRWWGRLALAPGARRVVIRDDGAGG